jgi:alpha-glucosidase
LREQPDLNWRNPEVEEAMHDVLRFWFERGIDGFRIDVMGMIVKHPDLADNPPNPDWKPGDRERASQLWVNNRNYPDTYDAVKRIRKVFDEYPDKMAVGEVFGTANEIARFYGNPGAPGLHLAFNFKFIHEQEPVNTPWEAETLARIVRNSEAAVPHGARPCYALGNHDRSRFVTRHNDDGRGQERARAAVLVVLALRNTPFIYYGEEIGMADVEIPEDRLQDPARIRTIGRDPERTPMQWEASPGRGFSTGEPWLPYGTIEPNVAAQDDDPGSLLSLYRRAIWLRKRQPALLEGTYREVSVDDGVWVFERRTGAYAVRVAINTAAEPRKVVFESGGCVLLATGELAEGPRAAGEPVELTALSACWFEIEPDSEVS